MTAYLSKELARRLDGSGVTARQVQYWLQTGAITGPRSEWTDRDVERLRSVGAAHRALVALGFGRKTIPTAIIRQIWDGLNDADLVVIRESPVAIHIAAR